MSAQLYFGSQTSGYWVNPHAADFHNVGIVCATEPLNASVATLITCKVENYGDVQVPDAVVRLYWVDPATTYLPNNCCLIFEWGPGAVPPWTHQPGSGGPLIRTVNWKPRPCVLGTNGGSIALLATVHSTSLGLYPGVPCETNSLTAVHNVFVVQSLAGAGGPTQALRMGGASEAPGTEHFAFAATNASNETVRTELIARPVTAGPKASRLDSAILTSAFTDVKVKHLMQRRCPDPQAPERIHLHLGIERVLSRYLESEQKGIDQYVYMGARIGHTGPLTEDLFRRLKSDATGESAENFELRPFESRQVILGVVPRGQRGDLNVIEIVQRRVEDKKEVGRVVVAFVVGKPYETAINPCLPSDSCD